MLSALLALPAWNPGHDACPTVTTVGSADFSLAEWVRKSWFIQEQQVLDFQPVTSNYCVAATYNLEGKTVPFFKGKVATVYNYANNDQARGLAVAEVEDCAHARTGGERERERERSFGATGERFPGACRQVNGPLTNAKNMTLCARAVNTTDSSRLAVAPCLLPNILAGPYWILGIGKAADGSYDWAVVIGGQPDVKWEDGCTTKESGVNNAGPRP